MKKKFDCVSMKQVAQKAVAKETKGRSRAEELAYFRSAGNRLWKERARMKARIRRRRGVSSATSRRGLGRQTRIVNPEACEGYERKV